MDFVMELTHPLVSLTVSVTFSIELFKGYECEIDDPTAVDPDPRSQFHEMALLVVLIKLMLELLHE